MSKRSPAKVRVVVALGAMAACVALTASTCTAQTQKLELHGPGPAIGLIADN